MTETITTTTSIETTIDEVRDMLASASQNWSGQAGATAAQALLHIIALEANLKVTNDDRIAVIEQRNKADRALALFKDEVRNAAIEVQGEHSGHISKDSLNEWLGALGLDPLVTKWDCDGTWQGMDLPSAVVEADDEEEALSKYRDALSSGEINVSLAINGSVDDTDDVVFGSNYISEDNDYYSDVEFDVDEADLSAELAD